MAKLQLVAVEELDELEAARVPLGQFLELGINFPVGPGRVHLAPFLDLRLHSRPRVRLYGEVGQTKGVTLTCCAASCSRRCGVQADIEHTCT
jgi:hypothetical protein